MTRKDFELIAATLAAVRDVVPSDSVDEIAHRFAWKLADTNPRFDREQFLAACGVLI